MAASIFLLAHVSLKVNLPINQTGKHNYSLITCSISCINCTLGLQHPDTHPAQCSSQQLSHYLCKYAKASDWPSKVSSLPQFDYLSNISFSITWLNNQFLQYITIWRLLAVKIVYWAIQRFPSILFHLAETAVGSTGKCSILIIRKQFVPSKCLCHRCLGQLSKYIEVFKVHNIRLYRYKDQHANLVDYMAHLYIKDYCSTIIFHLFT